MSERRYIDADALYEMARTNPNYKDFCRSQADLTSLRELLDEYPAADVEPVVRGTWINDEDYPDSGLKVCSTCGHDPLLNGHEERVLSKRCPNCGAHMSTERSGSGE